MIHGLVAPLMLLAGAVPAADPPTSETIRLTVHPAGAPVPALRYRLLPEVRDRTPGNALLLYHRAHTPEWFSAHRRDPDFDKKMERWRSMPLKELANEPVVLPAAALAELDRAARREYCDWELAPRLRQEGIRLLLPEIQTFREFASLLSVKARREIAEGKYDQAVRTLETSFAMSRHVGDAPTLIHSLVGVALAQVMSGRLQELMEQPDAPNLYWALTVLPRPFIDLRMPLQGERVFLDALLPGVREAIADPKAPPMNAEQVRGMVMKLAAEFEGPAAVDWTTDLALAALVAKAYPEAKRFLVAGGRTPEQVDALPMLQAVLMYEVFNYDRLFDDLIKWQSLPFWEARAGLQQVEQELKEARAKGDSGMVLATLLMPAVVKVHVAHVRCDRRIAVLRCVEALRLHAAAHDGKLPPVLSDIRTVPVPLDPVTGRLFDYQVDGDRATLIGPPPPGERPTASNSLRVEVTMKRKAEK